MDSTVIKNANAAKTNQQPRRMQPVRLPQGTADLVNRLLAARCGGRY